MLIVSSPERILKEINTENNELAKFNQQLLQSTFVIYIHSVISYLFKIITEIELLPAGTN